MPSTAAQLAEANDAIGAARDSLARARTRKARARDEADLAHWLDVRRTLLARHAPVGRARRQYLTGSAVAGGGALGMSTPVADSVEAAVRFAGWVLRVRAAYPDAAIDLGRHYVAGEPNVPGPVRYLDPETVR